MGRGRLLIAVDPGHGGRDSGAVGNGLKEKMVVCDSGENLGICHRIKHHLAEAGIGAFLTRSDDRYLYLGDRAKKAIEAGANAFVCVHCNSEAGNSARGAEVWVHAADEKGARLARLILQEFFKLPESKGMPNRGIKKTTKLAVLNGAHAHMPAVLIETAFISNPVDAANLADRYFREAWATAVTNAVKLYYGV